MVMVSGTDYVGNLTMNFEYLTPGYEDIEGDQLQLHQDLFVEANRQNTSFLPGLNLS